MALLTQRLARRACGERQRAGVLSFCYFWKEKEKGSGGLGPPRRLLLNHLPLHAPCTAAAAHCGQQGLTLGRFGGEEGIATREGEHGRRENCHKLNIFLTKPPPPPPKQPTTKPKTFFSLPLLCRNPIYLFFVCTYM